MVAYINLGLAGILAAICMWTDLKTMAIYNKHTYPAVAFGVIYIFITKQYNHLTGALIIFAMYLLLFILGNGKMGGGDVKLAAALSIFLGYEPIIYGTVVAASIMMAWGFIFTWLKSGELVRAVFVLFGKLPGYGMPYGAMLGPASVLIAGLLTVY